MTVLIGFDTNNNKDNNWSSKYGTITVCTKDTRHYFVQCNNGWPWDGGEGGCYGWFEKKQKGVVWFVVNICGMKVDDLSDWINRAR